MSTSRDPHSDPRGHTYTEAWRFECEARWLASLPKPARDRYLHGDGQRLKPLATLRGQPSVDALVSAARHYHQQRHHKNPSSPAGVGTAPQSPPVHPTHHAPPTKPPASGSSPAISTGGDSTPDEMVESGGGA